MAAGGNLESMLTPEEKAAWRAYQRGVSTISHLLHSGYSALGRQAEADLLTGLMRDCGGDGLGGVAAGEGSSEPLSGAGGGRRDALELLMESRRRAERAATEARASRRGSLNGASVKGMPLQPQQSPLGPGQGLPALPLPATGKLQAAAGQSETSATKMGDSSEDMLAGKKESAPPQGSGAARLSHLARRTNLASECGTASCPSFTADLKVSVKGGAPAGAGADASPVARHGRRAGKPSSVLANEPAAIAPGDKQTPTVQEAAKLVAVGTESPPTWLFEAAAGIESSTCNYDGHLPVQTTFNPSATDCGSPTRVAATACSAFMACAPSGPANERVRPSHSNQGGSAVPATACQIGAATPSPARSVKALPAASASSLSPAGCRRSPRDVSPGAVTARDGGRCGPLGAAAGAAGVATAGSCVGDSAYPGPPIPPRARGCSMPQLAIPGLPSGLSPGLHSRLQEASAAQSEFMALLSSGSSCKRAK
jgi:hypothetical protein